MAAAEPAEKDASELSRVCKVNNEAKDERLDLFSPHFDPVLLLQRPLASSAATAAGDVVLPNIRVAELLLPWGHQPQSIAAETAAAAAALEEEAAGTGVAGTGAIEMRHGGTKRSAFEAKLNAARNKQLKIGKCCCRCRCLHVCCLWVCRIRCRCSCCFSVCSRAPSGC